jgi:NADH dehydrogenase/NADH:ubiquinone oxidoreductase subunit G
VLCGRCTRICEERVGREAITYSGRSGERTVTAAFGKPSSTCIGCGSCASVCPTGVIRVEDRDGRRRVINKDIVICDLPLLSCVQCGETYATQALRDWTEARLGASEGERAHPDLCPSCSRSESAARSVRPMPRP